MEIVNIVAVAEMKEGHAKQCPIPCKLRFQFIRVIRVRFGTKPVKHEKLITL